MTEMAGNGLQGNESYLREIPTRVVVRTDERFIGLKAFFDHRAAESQGCS
jgi:hypothetical protein